MNAEDILAALNDIDDSEILTTSGDPNNNKKKGGKGKIIIFIILGLIFSIIIGIGALIFFEPAFSKPFTDKIQNVMGIKNDSNIHGPVDSTQIDGNIPQIPEEISNIIPENNENPNQEIPILETKEISENVLNFENSSNFRILETAFGSLENNFKNFPNDSLENLYEKTALLTHISRQNNCLVLGSFGDDTNKNIVLGIVSENDKISYVGNISNSIKNSKVSDYENIGFCENNSLISELIANSGIDINLSLNEIIKVSSEGNIVKIN